MNSENSKISKPHNWILNLFEKIDLRRAEKSIVFSNLTMYYIWKNIIQQYI